MTKTRRANLMGLGSLALVSGLLAGCGEDDDKSAGDADAASHWTYAEVDAWGETCASGREQSPIDLAEATSEDLADPELAYTVSAASVADNGHAIQTTLDDAGTMTLDGVTYTLRQFHVHTPGEHTVDGTTYAAELHLVHEADDGSLAVLGLLIEDGAADPVVAEVLDALPAEDTESAGVVESLDVTGLLPEDLRTFRYDGSLTTPPCSEGVAWSVLTQPVTWSGEQIAAFAERHPDSHRPPQPLGERVLLQDTH